MAHPQNSHRGFFSKSRVNIGTSGLFSDDYSSSTALITANSTGAKVAGSMALSGFANFMSQNSTGVLSLPDGVLPSGSSTAKMTGDSTGVVFAGDLTIGTHVLSSNSTGLTIGGALISTA